MASWQARKRWKESMGYKCKHSFKDCDGCGECEKPKRCEYCGNEDADLIETEAGWMCPDCFDKYLEEE